uniref:Conotoxin pc16c n=1 Tax=Conus pictus TaxID=1042615 RepID=CUGC_CONPB|nr:RecName: Full=Conotoxin pc16c [Conus pictus]
SCSCQKHFSCCD